MEIFAKLAPRPGELRNPSATSESSQQIPLKLEQGICPHEQGTRFEEQGRAPIESAIKLRRSSQPCFPGHG
jgi:hypothetical protein